jgi:hypothetical protein
MYVCMYVCASKYFRPVSPLTLFPTLCIRANSGDELYSTSIDRKAASSAASAGLGRSLGMPSQHKGQ